MNQNELNENRVKEFANLAVQYYMGKPQANADHLMAESYRVFPDEYDGVLYPKGVFDGSDDLIVGCGSLETSDSDTESTLYVAYSLKKGVCFVSIFEDDQQKFCICSF